jgi:biotin carboxyl carrier protein
MPGVVAFCEKSTGDAVEEGEVILILEAMKMENLIMAPMRGQVLSLAVKEGEKVARGTLLATIG